MSRDNLKKAAKELFGLDAKSKQEVLLSLEGFVADLEETAPWPEKAAAPQPARAAEPGAGAYVPAAPCAAETVPAAEADERYALTDNRRETSVIARGTTIVGRVRTDGHIEILGKVDGNVEAEGNVAVSGRVSGNIRGHHLELVSAQIKGNLQAGAGIFVSSDTVIIGDITAENIVFDGRIKGNVMAAQSAEFHQNSYLLGDITTRTLAIEPGAVINGAIRTAGTAPGGDAFDEFGTF